MRVSAAMAPVATAVSPPITWTARTTRKTGVVDPTCWPRRFLLGVALITVVCLLATAAVSKHYRSVGLSGTAGCLGIAALDAAVLTTVAVAVPVVTWPLILAVLVSTVRVAFTARILRPVLTDRHPPRAA